MVKTDPKELAALLDKARKGDSPALASLCSALEGFVRGYFEQRFKDREVVNDLCQETYVRLLDSILRVREAMKLRSFVTKVTFYVMQDHLRQRYKNLEDPIENFQDYYDEGQRSGKPDQQEIILDEIELNNAMATLSEKSQHILALKRQGYNYEEIAQQTGISVSGVKMQVKRSIELLRAILMTLFW